jgi:hypothetical protein
VAKIMNEETDKNTGSPILAQKNSLPLHQQEQEVS